MQFKAFTFFAALLAGSLSPLMAETPAASSLTGDAERGRRVFNQCRACHNLQAKGPRKLGPHLAELFGRPIAGLEGFDYSRALDEAGEASWSADTLDSWLQNPRSFLPGNKMPFGGIRDAQQRADLIQYLRETVMSGQSSR